jgi:hypothetical protein
MLFLSHQPPEGNFTRLDWALKGLYSKGKSFPYGPDSQHKSEIPFTEMQFDL